jgi:hypothetical protein
VIAEHGPGPSITNRLPIVANYEDINFACKNVLIDQPRAKLGAITTNIPYWNWYGFPSNYTTAYMFSQIMGYLCVGIVAALTMKGAAGKTLTAAA